MDVLRCTSVCISVPSGLLSIRDCHVSSSDSCSCRISQTSKTFSSETASVHTHTLFYWRTACVQAVVTVSVCVCVFPRVSKLSVCIQPVSRRLPPFHLQPVSASVLWRLQSDLHSRSCECCSSRTLTQLSAPSRALMCSIWNVCKFRIASLSRSLSSS